jgi:3-oxoacyl-[acyl-carrier-protein] synthase-3
LQKKLGIAQGNCACFDIRQQCSGFVYGLQMADAFIKTGMYKRILLVGAETHSHSLDYSTRGRDVMVLFGDGAGAVVLVPSQKPGIGSAHLHADGRYSEMLCVPGTFAEGTISGTPYVRMDGPHVFKFAVKVMAEVGAEALAANKVEVGAVDWFIPHQANIRIMEATAKKLGIPHDRMIATVDRHANTSAASIPLALDEAVRDGRIKAGHRILMIGVGGGFAWGSVFLTW